MEPWLPLAPKKFRISAGMLNIQNSVIKTQGQNVRGANSRCPSHRWLDTSGYAHLETRQAMESRGLHNEHQRQSTGGPCAHSATSIVLSVIRKTDVWRQFEKAESRLNTQKRMGRRLQILASPRLTRPTCTSIESSRVLRKTAFSSHKLASSRSLRRNTPRNTMLFNLPPRPGLVDTENARKKQIA